MKIQLWQILLWVGFAVFGLMISVIVEEKLENSREHKCFNEAADIWSSVNNDDYPNKMNDQEAYDKNSRQACATMYYISCLQYQEVYCDKTQIEKDQEEQEKALSLMEGNLTISQITSLPWKVPLPRNQTMFYSMSNDTNERSITWDYNYGGKEWKYFAMFNATCHQIPCSCVDWGCLAYCMECEGIE